MIPIKERLESDVLIVGGGIGGLMTAYRLAEKAPELSICLMEQGEEKESGASVINYAERKETKNRLKRQLYQLLCAYTGQTLPWGTLT